MKNLWARVLQMAEHVERTVGQARPAFLGIPEPPRGNYEDVHPNKKWDRYLNEAWQAANMGAEIEYVCASFPSSMGKRYHMFESAYRCMAMRELEYSGCPARHQPVITPAKKPPLFHRDYTMMDHLRSEAEALTKGTEINWVCAPLDAPWNHPLSECVFRCMAMREVLSV